MIPEKIQKKIKEKCGSNKEDFEVLMNLLEYEDSGKGKQTVHCKEVVEKYAKGEKIDED